MRGWVDTNNITVNSMFLISGMSFNIAEHRTMHRTILDEKDAEILIDGQIYEANIAVLRLR